MVDAGQTVASPVIGSDGVALMVRFKVATESHHAAFVVVNVYVPLVVYVSAFHS